MAVLVSIFEYFVCSTLEFFSYTSFFHFVYIVVFRNKKLELQNFKKLSYTM